MIDAIDPVTTNENAIATPTLSTAWHPVCHITYKRDEWVKLLEKPSESSFDEALLLCPHAPEIDSSEAGSSETASPEAWVAWIPDYGEIVLNRNCFYC